MTPILARGWKEQRQVRSGSGGSAPGAPGAPGAANGRRGRRGRLWVKVLLALLLLFALGWVGLIAYQYWTTKAPLARLPAVPPPAAAMFEEPPIYARSIYGIQDPLSVAVAADGTVYVTESGGDRLIHIFDSEGEPLGTFAAPETTSLSRIPVYLAAAPDGRVYVTDREQRTIYIFDAAGEPAGTVPSPFEDGWMPLGIDIDAEGRLYVTDVTPGNHRVLVLAPDFSLLRTVEGDFSFPNSVAVGKSGMMFVSDSNNGRVQIFDQDGNLVGGIARGMAAGDLSLPRGLALDDDNDLLFVVDASASSVHMYSIADGTPELLHVFGDDGPAVANLAFPNDIALDGHGNIYVTDRENDRIQVWRY